ncbi:MAG: CoA transferase subunit A [bacterium]|nr:CoA transferase subunit A [bacterium]
MNVIDEGKGILFADPDPDKLRAYFREKSGKMTDKVMPLKEAVEKFTKDGYYLGIGGFGANRTPVASCHELIRQGRKNMALAGHTATHDFQLLCAGEVFDRLDVAYVVGLEARGLSPCARRYLQSGKVKVTEWTNYSLSVRLRAAAMGISYIPCRNMMGTDTFRYSAAKMAECPYTGQKMVLLPALSPDVSLIHVHEADKYGNCRFSGITVADMELAAASKRLIITTEKLITNDEIRNDPSATKIPFYLVDAVCEVPYGAYPGTMPYEYFSDEPHLKEWLTVEKDQAKFKEFLNDNIYNCANHFEYVEKNGGLEKMRQLRHQEFLLGKEG